MFVVAIVAGYSKLAAEALKGTFVGSIWQAGTGKGGKYFGLIGRWSSRGGSLGALHSAS